MEGRRLIGPGADFLPDLLVVEPGLLVEQVENALGDGGDAPGLALPFLELRLDPSLPEDPAVGHFLAGVVVAWPRPVVEGGAEARLVVLEGRGLGGVNLHDDVGAVRDGLDQGPDDRASDVVVAGTRVVVPPLEYRPAGGRRKGSAGLLDGLRGLSLLVVLGTQS